MPIDILVAEDDTVSRDLLCRILSADANNRVVQAAAGAEAWTLLNDPGRRFDVAFLDIMMPHASGLELAERIRNTNTLCNLPVIICTALHDRATVTKAAALGLRHYIVKPVNKQTVYAKLQAATGYLPESRSQPPTAAVIPPWAAPAT